MVYAAHTSKVPKGCDLYSYILANLYKSLINYTTKPFSAIKILITIGKNRKKIRCIVFELIAFRQACRLYFTFSIDINIYFNYVSQEVTCYIDYNVSMPAQNLWRVDIVNRDSEDATWDSIRSLVRLVHVDSGSALRFSGRQLPAWGFHQHEVVADKVLTHQDTIWNVEEHRYTKGKHTNKIINNWLCMYNISISSVFY